LLTKAVDLLPGEAGLTADRAVQLEKRFPGRFTVLWKPSLSFNHLDMMLDNPDLADIRVRRALVQALDREAMVQAFFHGRATVAHQWVSPLDPVHRDGVRTYPFDSDAAARLLDAAGWKRGDDGLRRNGAGRPLSIELRGIGGEGGGSGDRMLQYIQDRWMSLGIGSRIVMEPLRILAADTLRHRKFKGGVLYAWTVSPQSVPRLALHSRQIPSEGNGWSGQNFPGYRSAEMDRVLDTLETACDADVREDAWARFQSLYAEDLPALPLMFPHVPFILPAWLKGLVPTGHQYPSTFWVEDWHRG